MILRKFAAVIFALFFLALVSESINAQEQNPARRIGIFIGSNNGGRDRVLLRYAVSDARAVSRVFGEMGGIIPSDNIILVEPSVTEINRRLDTLARDLTSTRGNSQRTELVFYYSGHSDEEGLLLNRQRYSYRDLRERINRIDTDMRIVILDSCSSGAITRAKGGVKTPPFLFDSSVSVEGYAFLTSSSADEASQESDSIESSYFTHCLIAGLRGAADTVGDGKVTLNELYRFAYTETLAMTELSIYGAQHPSYDMQISGSGDVILTDIKETSATLFIDGELTGRITIRDASDFLVAELTKVNQNPIELGLGAGFYRITIQKGSSFYRAEVMLNENTRTPLGMGDFSLIASSSGNRNRGDGYEPDWHYHDSKVNLQVIPGYNLLGYGGEDSTNNFLLGLLVAKGHNLKGLALAPIGLINMGYVYGVQSSYVFNIIRGYSRGLQTTGVFNISSNSFMGIQVAGVFNMAIGKITDTHHSDVFVDKLSNIFGENSGSIMGLQAAGVFNFAAAKMTGVQTAGVFNFAAGKMTGVQAAGIFNLNPSSFKGLQTAGVFNYANGLTGLQAAVVNVNTGEESRAVQVGVVNVSRSEDTVPVGLVNFVKNGIMHPSIYMDDLGFLNAGFRSGSKHFYGLLGFGVGGGSLPGRSGDDMIMTRGGFGLEIPIGKAFINIDITSGNIINLDERKRQDDDTLGIIGWGSGVSSANLVQLRLSGGYKFLPHLAVFAGVSYDYIYRNSENFPAPEDFALVDTPGGTFGKHTHKLGFFAGVQF